MKYTAPQIAELHDAMREITAADGASRGLPNATYHDESLFAFERDQIIGRSWAAIGYRSELIGPGFAKPVDLMGIPLLIIMDKSDDLRVFHNVCSHRGMKLVREHTQLRAVIRCPYQ